MKKLAIALIWIFILSSCEKENRYPIIKKDHVVFMYEGDTIKQYFENIDVSQTYYGDDVDAWAKSQAYRVTTLYSCGQIVDGLFYKPLTVSITHMVFYIDF